jgi:hypothetical protein
VCGSGVCMGEEGGLDTSRLQGRGRDANQRLLSLPGSWARMSDRCKGLNVGVTLYEVAPTIDLRWCSSNQVLGREWRCRQLWWQQNLKWWWLRQQ